MGSQLRIKEALPELFRRAFPMLDPSTEMLLALSLLKFHEIDALPLSFDAKRKPRAVMGSSSLARLAQLDGNALSKFLKRPCEEASAPLSSVRADRSVSVLLNKFQQTRFGFAMVEESNKVGALVGLWDMLGLYESGTFQTELTVDEVASPIFSLPSQTTAREALKAMFQKRIRRVFVGWTPRFLGDRGIIERLFSPGELSIAMRNPSKDFLGMPLSEFRLTRAGEVRPGTTVGAAARMLLEERGQCLVFDEKVVTPWDVIMKPWKARALKIGRSN